MSLQVSDTTRVGVGHRVSGPMDWCGAVVVTLVKPPPAHVGEEVMGLWWSSVLLANPWDPLVSCGDVESTDLSSQHAAPTALS